MIRCNMERFWWSTKRTMGDRWMGSWLMRCMRMLMNICSKIPWIWMGLHIRFILVFESGTCICNVMSLLSTMSREKVSCLMACFMGNTMSVTSLWNHSCEIARRWCPASLIEFRSMMRQFKILISPVRTMLRRQSSIIKRMASWPAHAISSLFFKVLCHFMTFFFLACNHFVTFFFLSLYLLVSKLFFECQILILCHTMPLLFFPSSLLVT